MTHKVRIIFLTLALIKNSLMCLFKNETHVNNNILNERKSMYLCLHTVQFVNIFDHLDINHYNGSGNNNGSQRRSRDVIEKRR